MTVHPRAGKPATRDMLEDIPRLITAYYSIKPDPTDPGQMVSFGTSGHRGCSLAATFNENHVMAVCQAVCEHRRARGIDGPLFLGRDTHALSEPAFATALEVFAANGVAVRYQEGFGDTPTPVISHAILSWNRGRKTGQADGIVITPSHNPPKDGGIKYNPPDGGPADYRTTAAIQDGANQLLIDKLVSIKRIPYQSALAADGVEAYDYVRPYVDDLGSILRLDAVAAEGIKIGADPLGGSGIAYWEPIAETYGLDITVTNDVRDPTFGFMSVDKDGVIRMDCSSPYAMAGLIALRDKFDIAFGNDPDFDRHGIVTCASGLLNPNHYLSVAVDYLFRSRENWSNMAIGKTVVTSSMLDRVACGLGKEVFEVPVGFKWFVTPLLTGSCAFGGEESAGASFVRFDGSPWTTDKDGIIMNLLAAEITAVTGRDPGELYKELEQCHGAPLYRRSDAPATSEQKAAFRKLTPESVRTKTLAGDSITAKMTHANGNGEPIGGLKVTTDKGWFAARPSGTESIYKIYAESFCDETHLTRIEEEAKGIVDALFEK